ncbi:MAG: helicase-exonuclease AddAB subunit AddB [Clostridiaceae bacterium]
MSLRFIYGRAGSGKSTFCLQDINKKIETGWSKPLILLVPEQFSFQAEKNVIRHLGESGAFRVQVLSFSRMAQKVLGETGGLARQHINTAGRNMLIYSIMSQNISSLKVFGKAARKKGFTASISDIITEFKRYGITPETVASSLEGIENKSLKEKMEDIHIIYSEFERRLHERYIDQEDDLTILSSKLSQSSIFDGAEIWIDEFASFTPQECDILKKLFTKASRISITLCSDGKLCDGSTDVFLPIKNTEDTLIKIIAELNINYEKPVYLYGKTPGRFTGSAEIGHLEQHLFSYPYCHYDKETENISILRSLNKYDEVEEAARDIIRLCRDKDILFRDMAVVSGDLEGYESLIRAVFGEYGIPFFIDGKDKIVNSPLIILLSSALDIASKNWSYESVFRYLKTGLLNFEREDIDLLENYVLANGIKGKDWTNGARWERPLNSGFNDDDISETEAGYIERINAIRIEASKPLLSLSDKIRGKKEAKEMAEAFYDFMCGINIQEAIEKLITKFEYMGQLDRSKEYRQVWDIIVELLEQVVEVLGEEIITGDEFAKIINAGFQEYEIGVIPPAIDQVLVGNIQRLRSHEIKVLYILGVNDGVFPSSVSGEGILTDEDRLDLIGRGVQVMKDSKSLAFEEQYLTYTTLTTANKYLRLSFPISDFDGKSKRPSIIISRLKKVFPKIREESSVIKDRSETALLNGITARKPAFNDMLRAIKENPGSRVLKSEICWFRNSGEWKERLESAANGFAFENEAQLFDTKAIRELYGKKLNLSVSRLEKFVECPFSYFVQYGLKAKERKIYKLGTPDIGSLMHESLYSFSERLKEEGLNWENIGIDQSDKLISEIVEEKIACSFGAIFNSSKRYRFIAQNAKDVLKRSVSLISQHMKRGEFRPEGYETSFGLEGGYPPIEVELGSGEKVSLIGKIDRFDILKDEEKNEAYIRIVDYKSGSREFRITDVYHRLQMQLLIYLDAILSEVGKQIEEEVLPAGILYLKLDDPILRDTKDFSDDEIEAKIMKMLKMSGLIINNINVIDKMDSGLRGNSDIIPVSVNKDNTLSANSSTASLEQFGLLRQYVRESIKDICEEILEGNISINPYRNKGMSPCRYCAYSSICQFDPSVKGNRYRAIKEIKEEEAWELMKKEVESMGKE